MNGKKYEICSMCFEKLFNHLYFYLSVFPSSYFQNTHGISFFHVPDRNAYHQGADFDDMSSSFLCVLFNARKDIYHV